MKVNIVGDNVVKHSEILKSLGQDVEVEIEASLPELQELLKHTAGKPVNIKKLTLKEEDININKDNIAEYAETFASLPTFGEVECHGKIKVSIPVDKPEAQAIMKDLSRNKFKINNFMNTGFKDSDLPAASADAITSIIKNCRVENYKGHLTPQMTSEMFHDLKGHIFASVLDNESFNALKGMILEKNWGRLKFLRVIISPLVDPEVLLPLPGHLNEPPQLFITDVNDENVERACNIAWRLKPSDGFKEYHHMLFPRCKLSSKGMKELINGLRVKVGSIPGNLIIPTKCKPSSEEEQAELQELGYNIAWGNNGTMGPFNTDSWENKTTEKSTTRDAVSVQPQTSDDN